MASCQTRNCLKPRFMFLRSNFRSSVIPILHHAIVSSEIMELWNIGIMVTENPSFQHSIVPSFHHSILSFLLLIPYSPSRVFLLQSRYSFLMSVNSVGKSGLFYSNGIKLFCLGIHTVHHCVKF
jgi:hypothetical protein